ncbi:hypothetical protein [Mycobacterium avium]|uniref:hypothetical protein n=1 Tax=Mycobacterium avium TaxID=1764 RepID=UPI0011505BC9|nr:hypothetical protein [Mycobacterium avium]MBZ4612402.1 hypothetical protein [Mycobacterium avium subsp. hominissuis]
MSSNDLFGIEWHESGYFRCATSTICVKGVAGDIHALAELARRAGFLKTARAIYEASDAFADLEYEPATWSLAQDHFASDFQRKRSEQTALAQLRRVAASLPGDRAALVRLAKDRANLLNEVAPLVPSPQVFATHTPGVVVAERRALRGFAAWVDWIRPELVVATAARAWNDIDRTPPRNSVIHIAAALATSDLAEWVEQMSPARDPVSAFRVEGPAGPIFEVGRGTHRVHAARLFGFRLLALVRPAGLPVAVRPADREISAVWSGLRDRGLLEAEVSNDDWWYVRSTVGEWMLASPPVAAQINAAYERLYPGALSEATGLTVTELTSPEHWKRALVGRGSWWRRARQDGDPSPGHRRPCANRS